MSYVAGLVCGLMLCAAVYAIGLTVGYAGCVAGASEIFTNAVMRGQ
jgi:hypothetical protein